MGKYLKGRLWRGNTCYYAKSSQPEVFLIVLCKAKIGEARRNSRDFCRSLKECQSIGEKLAMGYKRMYFTFVNHKPKKGWGERRGAKSESTQWSFDISKAIPLYSSVLCGTFIFYNGSVINIYLSQCFTHAKVICLFFGKIFVTENKKKSTTPLACSHNYFNTAVSLHLPSYKSNWAIQIVLVKECMGKGGCEENLKRIKLMGERIKSLRANPSGTS